MSQFLERLVTWLLHSSADPRKMSLTVKMALLSVVPWVMQTLGFACALGTVCVAFDQSMLEVVAADIAQVVYYVLTAVSMLGFAYGAVRKIWRTLTGQNKALQ